MFLLFVDSSIHHTALRIFTSKQFTIQMEQL
jgi:hypothetical protein